MFESGVYLENKLCMKITKICDQKYYLVNEDSNLNSEARFGNYGVKNMFLSYYIIKNI